jgi:hypothetical protein
LAILQGGGQGGGSDILSLLGPLSGALSGVSLVLSQETVASKLKQYDSQNNKSEIEGESQAILSNTTDKHFHQN